MKVKHAMTDSDSLGAHFRLAVFGGIDGLVIGLLFEVLYPFYESWEWRQEDEFAARMGLGDHIQRIPFSHNLVIPILCVATFAVAACLIHAFRTRRGSSVSQFWQFVAVAGTTSAFAIYFVERIATEIAFFAQPNARHGLFITLFTWLVCVLIACVINLAYALLMRRTLSKLSG